MDLIALLIQVIVEIIIVAPVLWLVGRTLVGKEKAKFTDAIWIVILGVVIGAIVGVLISNMLVSAIIMLIIWLALIKHFFDCGWLMALAIAIIAVIVFVIIFVVLIALLAIIGIILPPFI